MWHFKKSFFGEIHVVFQVTWVDICKYYKGVFFKVVSIGLFF